MRICTIHTQWGRAWMFTRHFFVPFQLFWFIPLRTLTRVDFKRVLKDDADVGDTIYTALVTSSANSEAAAQNENAFVSGSSALGRVLQSQPPLRDITDRVRAMGNNDIAKFWARRWRDITLVNVQPGVVDARDR